MATTDSLESAGTPEKTETIDEYRIRRRAMVAELRPSYQAELAEGTDRFFERRREDCPWCSSKRLKVRLRTKDFLQRKPGTFVLEQCADCRHIFQNPRLSHAGLDFYYRDFYEGLFGRELGQAFEGAEGDRKQRHADRARAMLTHLRPKRWLDVGTAGGDFCVGAKKELPDTVFDGLDVGTNVVKAKEEGRIEEAYQGFLPDHATALAGRYDAVSMFHVLEHTVDQKAELAAARKVLRQGGHLMIEVPDPESHYARLLGKYWVPWFQPQHLHFVSVGNLNRALRELGFTVVAVDRRRPHIPFDFLGAFGMLLIRMQPFRNEPWLPKEPGKAGTWLCRTVFRLGVPVMPFLYFLDRLLGPVVSRIGFSNAYRVVARKD
ncbi:class I SAM-dependent methyltransferase [Streptomyces indicus]|uniref:Methyltransferase domain-containing protein n=1 Tax=Streptomyces indicus TaxID=417292 RepID=A0A1G8YR26_9ACTN|nr:class I SAM-dependent methyltransferase [Streptomyces indicus]SDK05299.1 Methyltransferase domain-containing protein [Streptomyces indicus]